MELEAYLDGQLHGERLSAFERRVRDDSALAAQLALQRRIDGALTRCFVAPPAPSLTAHVASENGQAAQPRIGVRPQRRVVRWPLAIAAMLVLFIGVPVMVWEWRDIMGVGTPKVQYADTRAMALDLAYNQQVGEKQFKPDWVCKDQDEFAGYFVNRLGQPLKMKPLAANATDWGVSYTGGISSRSMGVLARIDGQPVIVFVDRLDCDNREGFSQACHLNLFRRELGELVLYEVSPFDQPKMLDLFYVPTAK